MTNNAILSLLEGLNEAQEAAVTTASSAVLVIAGAGSGKTQTLGSRVAYLINGRTSPTEILLITFTNKAGREMRERVEKLLPHRGLSRLRCGTFHHICVGILRRWPQAVGLKSGFVIYDVQDRDDILYGICQGRQPKVKEADVKEVLNLVEKNLPDEAVKLFGPEKLRAIKGVIREYRTVLSENNAVDFHYILSLTRVLLQKKPGIRQKLREEWRHILVDEFQDTNPIQWDILRLLNPYNIFMVGDDGQAIYGFRGGDVEIMLRIPEYYPDVEIIKLEKNYRSLPAIIEGANRVIAHNKNQYPKTLVAVRSHTSSIPPVWADVQGDRYEEGSWVAEQIEALMDSYDVSPREIAILGRTHRYLIPVADSLADKDIPFSTVKARDIWTTAPARLFISFCRVLINPGDNYSMQYILRELNAIDKLDLLLVRKHRLEKSMTMLEAAADIAMAEGTPWNPIVGFFDDYDITDGLNSPSRVADGLANMVPIEEMFRKQTRTSKAAQVSAVYSAVNRWSADNFPRNTVEEFIDFIAGRQLQDQVEDIQEVAVMTVHAAKGLEWRVVFVIGCAEGYFPHDRAISEGTEAEERRLFYVAITRARDILRLSRPSFGRGNFSFSPSRYLREMGPLNITA